MPTVMVYHEIKDKDHWLASPRREQLFGPLGITNIRTFVDPENPTRAGLVMDVPDVEAVKAAAKTEAGRDAMAYDGVLPETAVFSSRRNPRNPTSNTRRGVMRAVVESAGLTPSLQKSTRLLQSSCS
jgi:hypothetical protein